MVCGIRNLKRRHYPSSILYHFSYIHTAISYCTSDFQTYFRFPLSQHLTQKDFRSRTYDGDLPLFALLSQFLQFHLPFTKLKPFYYFILIYYYERNTTTATTKTITTTKTTIQTTTSETTATEAATAEAAASGAEGSSADAEGPDAETIIPDAQGSSRSEDGARTETYGNACAYAVKSQY